MAIKPWEELTIQDDYMFKRVMSHKRLCKKMIEKLLQIQIRDIKYLEEEKSIKSSYESKGIRLDVYVEDDKQTVYNVEMQVRKPTDDSLYKRARYYQSMIDADLLMTGSQYYELKSTIIIFICPFTVLDGKRHIYTFKSVCMEDKAIELPDGTMKMLVSTKGTMDDIPADVKAFLNYVDGIMDNDEFVQEIDQEIKNLKGQEAERASYMTYELKIQEEREEGRKEGRKEGRIEGRKEGRIEGRKEGRIEGHKEGRKEGRVEGIDFALITTIRNLMETMNLTAQQAMEAMKIPASDQKKYAALVQHAL